MPDTDQWEARELGASEAYVKPSTLDGVDEALGLKAISIRLQTSMIDELKARPRRHRHPAANQAGIGAVYRRRTKGK